MPRSKSNKWLSIILGLALIFSTLAPAVALSHEAPYNLEFDAEDFDIEFIIVDDEEIPIKAYRNIVYVKNPVILVDNSIIQTLNVFVPADIDLDDYTKHGGPIFLPNTIGGYFPGPAGDVSRPEIARALAEGYVVVSPGARGSNSLNQDEVYVGKSPAGLVDLKAAVRYLRYNDKVMPGDAEMIISSGTSAGGAMSTLLGATGNNRDYEPYLLTIGAAKEKDHIYAVNAYCPITNLDNSDTAYEWMFYGIEKYSFLGGGDVDLNISAELKALFPGYVNSLGLKLYQAQNAKGVGLFKAPGQIKKGVPLTLDENGDGSFKEYVNSFVIDSAQTALDKGADLSGFSFITIDDGIVVNVDFDEYAKYEKDRNTGEYKYESRMKGAPSFDWLNNKSRENLLFGTTLINAQHFTEYGYQNSAVGGSMADAQIVKMMNPMEYIGKPATTTSTYWRIRHGAVDRDTALAIPVILATKLMNLGYQVDFAVPWDQGHGGNYDLDELFDWVEMVTN